MLYILSPTKTMHDSHVTEGYGAPPKYLAQANTLITQLKKLSKSEVNTLMKMSENLQESTIQGYQEFKTKASLEHCSSAILTYAGEAFNSMGPENWNKDHKKFADKHVRILSGLYGILKPSDLIQNYRLEMGAKSKSILGETLYQYWAETITKEVNEELNNHSNQILVNLASNEYAKTINKELNYPQVNIEFKEYKNDKLKVISFNAKKARGMMIDYIVRNQVDTIDALKKFDLDGYSLEQSSADHLLFIK